MDTNLGMITSTKVERPRLFLCKNNSKRTVISEITDFINHTRHLILGQVNELNFTIPYLNENYPNEENIVPTIDLINIRLLVKFVNKNEEEWYLINSIADTVNQDSDAKNVKCFSLNYEMSNILLTNYNTKQVVEGMPYTLKEFLLGKYGEIEGILNEVQWELGGIDQELLKDNDNQDIKRAYNVSGSKNILDCIYDLAKIFNATIVYDTNKRLIYFKYPDNVGKNRGLIFNYYNYLDSLSRDEQSDEMVTELKVFGKDNLTISDINPDGSNTLKDYSYYMRGYDPVKGTHSPYMSDDLCQALIDYKEKINQNKGEFKSLVEQKNILVQALNVKKYTELVSINTRLSKVQAELELNRATGTSTDEQLLINKKNITKQLAAKNNEINILNQQIKNTENKIKELQNLMALENNLTQTQISDLFPFRIQKEFRDEKYTSDFIKNLYLAGVAQFKTLQTPKTTIELNIVDFLQSLDCQLDWDKLQGLCSLGDTISITYDRFKLDVEAKIIGIEYDYENQTIKLTISNIHDFKTKERRISDLIYGSIGTTANVNTLTNQINVQKQNISDINNIINNIYDTASRQITSGLNGTTTLNSRGITSKLSSNSNKMIRINAGTISNSEQGEDDLETCLDWEGLHGEKLVGNITVDGNKLKLKFMGTDISNYFPNDNNLKQLIENIKSNNTNFGGNNFKEYVLSNNLGTELFKAFMGTVGGNIIINDNNGVEKIYQFVDSDGESNIRINNKDKSKVYLIKTLPSGELEIINTLNNNYIKLGENISFGNDSNNKYVKITLNNIEINTLNGKLNMTDSELNGIYNQSKIVVRDGYSGLQVENNQIYANSVSCNIGNLYTGDYISLGNGKLNINSNNEINITTSNNINLKGAKVITTETTS